MFSGSLNFINQFSNKCSLKSFRIQSQFNEFLFRSGKIGKVGSVFQRAHTVHCVKLVVVQKHVPRETSEQV